MIFKQWRINKEAQAEHYAKIERLLEEIKITLYKIEFLHRDNKEVEISLKVDERVREYLKRERADDKAKTLEV